MDTWTKVGTIAAVVAAGGTIVAIAVSWWYGHGVRGDSRKAITYDRLREARELVGEMDIKGSNVRWAECNEAGAQLRAVISTIDAELPNTKAIAEIKWSQEMWAEDDLPNRAAAARDELEQISRRLLA